MTSNQTTENDEFDGIRETDESPSVDDFIRELEAKEKDLHISAETVIEVEDADFDDQNIPDFIRNDLAAAGIHPAASAAAAPAIAKPNQVTELQNQIRGLKDQVSSLVAERVDAQKESKRRLQEFENFKRRMERERTETFSNQLVNLTTQMLPVLDNLNRALDFASTMPDEKHEEIQQFFDGIVLVNQQINEVFAGMGVQQIAAAGQEFDPHFHEAAAAEETADLPPNTIAVELLRGYRIGNRVIRHSMVRVATAPKQSDIGEVSDVESRSSDSDAEDD
jgi:molecular chaperone GrpE